MPTTLRLPSLALDLLAGPLLAHARANEPDQELDNGVDVYLRRWYLERSRDRGNAYLHNTLRSDCEREHHDHPWDNLTICLSGVIVEEMPDGEGGVERAERTPGAVVFRKAEDRHRLHVDGPAWTLFLTGPKAREWGFHHEGGWMHNQDFFRMRGYA